jgi:alpha-L-fucosidase
VQLLVKIVSRGGNLLMNIGPGPDGDWDPVAYQRLQGISAWMKINGEGIYNSKSVAPYSTGNIYYTKAKNEKAIYAFMLSDNDKVLLPATITVKVSKPKRVTLLGSKQSLKWKQQGDEIVISIPAGLQQNSGLNEAACFKMEY